MHRSSPRRVAARHVPGDRQQLLWEGWRQSKSLQATDREVHGANELTKGEQEILTDVGHPPDQRQLVRSQPGRPKKCLQLNPGDETIPVGVGPKKAIFVLLQTHRIHNPIARLRGARACLLPL